MARVAVFIDGGYIDRVLRDEFSRIRIDYRRLSDALTQHVAPGAEILRIYYYHCLPYQDNPPTDEQRQRTSSMQSFFRGLRRTPRIEVREGRLAYRGQDSLGQPIFEQKRVDLQLGVDLSILAGKRLIDYAVIVTGDSDLIPAIEAAKNEGVVVCVAHGDRPHDELLDAADERIRINQSIIAASQRAALPP